MGRWSEMSRDGITLVGYLKVIDQNGIEVMDEDIVDTARNVYASAGDFINDLLIPGLNDILYANRKFPMGERNQEVYEDHGFRMMRAAYEVAAYSGLGKVPGKDLVVIPADPVEIDESYFGCPTFLMSVKVLEL